jgi:hypothetical protein
MRFHVTRNQSFLHAQKMNEITSRKSWDKGHSLSWVITVDETKEL